MDHVNLAITVAVECQTSVQNSLQGSGQLTVLQLLKARETASQCTIIVPRRVEQQVYNFIACLLLSCIVCCDVFDPQYVNNMQTACMDAVG